MKIELLTEVVHVVAGLKQIASRNFSKLIRWIVVVAVDSKDRKWNVDDLIWKITDIGLSVQSDFYLNFFAASEHISSQHVQASKEALFGRVYFIE